MRCTSEMKVSSVADCDYHVIIESFYVNLGAVIFRTGWATGAAAPVVQICATSEWAGLVVEKVRSWEKEAVGDFAASLLLARP
jgi:hypothetical protein